MRRSNPRRRREIGDGDPWISRRLEAEILRDAVRARLSAGIRIRASPRQVLLRRTRRRDASFIGVATISRLAYAYDDFARLFSSRDQHAPRPGPFGTEA